MQWEKVCISNTCKMPEQFLNCSYFYISWTMSDLNVLQELMVMRMTTDKWWLCDVTVAVLLKSVLNIDLRNNRLLHRPAGCCWQEFGISVHKINHLVSVSTRFSEYLNERERDRKSAVTWESLSPTDGILDAEKWSE